MQRTGFIYIDGVKYQVLIRTQTKTTEWATVVREMPNDEPDVPADYEEGLSSFVNDNPDVAEALKAGSTIRL